MSDILDITCTSVSVPRPRFVARKELSAMLREPDIADDDKVSLSDPLFTEIATMRIAELVRSGMVSRMWPMSAGSRLTWDPIFKGHPWPTYDSNRQFWSRWD